jgi:O-antigen biosynthesis protein
MIDPPPPSNPADPAQDVSAVLRRLRAAEAAVEKLQDAVRSQESLADRLAVSMEESAQGWREFENSLQSVGVRGSYRLGKARLLSWLPKWRKEKEQLDRAGDGSSLRSGEQGPLADPRYDQWIELYDTLDDAARESLSRRIGDLSDPPLISVIFPVYNTPEDYLRQAIESVRAQLYTRWELCIADDCSTEPHVAKVLDEYALLDDRIMVRRRDVNGHISASTNTAISLASGRWLCLMDHDDLLAEHALAVVALAISQKPDAAIIYSDEDHIGPDNHREDPYFKPDFDPLLLLGQNYFSHLCMIRADLVAQVGGLREGYEGSQDWDLVLRVIEQVRTDQVLHIPHVLYHWRVHPESTASSVSAKPYVVDASRRVVQEHLDRIGVAAEVTTVWGSSFNRVRWILPPDPPKVSVIFLPRTGRRLRRCVESIRALTTYPNVEVIVLDDGAFRPPMRQFLSDQADLLTIVENHADLSDSAQRNRAAAAARGDVLCFVHDDVEVLSSSWLEEVVGVLSHPGIGCAGIKLLYPDMAIQHAGIVVGIGGTIGYPHRLHFDRLSYGYFGRLRLAQCPSAVSWACLAVRREAFDAVGGFSEEHFSGVFGDVDLCLRLNEAGWRTGWSPHAEMLHYELPGDTRGVDGENAVRFDRDIRYLHQRWGKWIENDPSYNPNLSLAHESFSLAWPPRQALS